MFVITRHGLVGDFQVDFVRGWAAWGGQRIAVSIAFERPSEQILGDVTSDAGGYVEPLDFWPR